MKGKANYYAKDYKGAISAYKNAIEIPNLRIQFHEAIMWHLCVAYLQNNETMQCEHILNEIEKIKNPKYEINKLDLSYIQIATRPKSIFSPYHTCLLATTNGINKEYGCAHSRRHHRRH